MTVLNAPLPFNGMLYDDFYLSRHYQLPDFFSVYIPASDSGEMAAKRLIVEIINKPIVKPYLGGYVHKKTCKIDLFIHLTQNLL